MGKIKLVLSLFIAVLALNMNAQRNANDGISLAQKFTKKADGISLKSANDGISLKSANDGISLKNANDGISLKSINDGILLVQKEESLLQLIWVRIKGK